MSYTAFDNTYENIFSLAKDLGEKKNWSSVIHDDAFLDFIRENDEKKAERIKVLLLQSIPEDVLIFRVREALNPFLPFAFNGRTFNDLKDLGETLLSYSPTPDPVYLSILRYELIGEYMKTTLYSESHKKEYEEIARIEKISREDLIYAYYLMGYHLSKSQSIIYENVKYENIYNLTYYLAKKEKDLSAFGSYLSFSPLLMAYAEYSKDGEILKNYLHICEELENSKSQLDDFMQKRNRS